MEEITVSKKELSYTFTATCPPDDVPTVIRQMEQMAEEVRKLMPSLPKSALQEDIPSVASAESTSQAVMMLLTSPWGLTARDMKAISGALLASGKKVPVSTLSGVLHYLVKQGRLVRKKLGANYAYHVPREVGATADGNEDGDIF